MAAFPLPAKIVTRVSPERINDHLIQRHKISDRGFEWFGKVKDDSLIRIGMPVHF